MLDFFDSLKDTTFVVSFFLGSTPHSGAPPFGD